MASSLSVAHPCTLPWLIMDMIQGKKLMLADMPRQRKGRVMKERVQHGGCEQGVTHQAWASVTQGEVAKSSVHLPLALLEGINPLTAAHP